MKTNFTAAILCLSLLSASCAALLEENPRLTATLPELPAGWEDVLGDPHWRLEWFDADGRKQAATLTGRGMEIQVPGTFANPVLATPFWPKKGIEPGVFRPAGAIFPFDVSGKKLDLSWQGGVDATLFVELAAAANSSIAPSASADLRLPWNFNWPRFRRLFLDANINAEVIADPWLADWTMIAEKTVRSGFDRRRLVPEARADIELPLDSGPWLGTSPFAAPLLFDGVPTFAIRTAAGQSDTWVCAEGILRAGAGTWIWREFSASSKR